MFTLSTEDEAHTAHALGVSARHVEHWRQKTYEVPPHAANALERLRSGWQPRRPWLTDRMWLANTLKANGQDAYSLAQALGICIATAKRYVKYGTGPKQYLMLEIEAWLDTKPAPRVVRPRGRPKQTYIPTPEEEFTRRLMYDPEFSARYDAVSAMLMRPGGTPAERLEDLALIRLAMGY